MIFVIFVLNRLCFCFCFKLKVGPWVLRSLINAHLYITSHSERKSKCGDVDGSKEWGRGGGDREWGGKGVMGRW